MLRVLNGSVGFVVEDNQSGEGDDDLNDKVAANQVDHDVKLALPHLGRNHQGLGQRRRRGGGVAGGGRGRVQRGPELGWHVFLTHQGQLEELGDRVDDGENDHRHNVVGALVFLPVEEDRNMSTY